MDFFVNDEKIDVTLENEQTIGDVLKSFEMTCEQNDAAVIGICVDNEKITAESFDAVSLKPLAADTKFEFTMITKQAVFDSFKKLAVLFTELAARMETIPVELQTGRDQQANAAIKNLADSIEEFCHIAALASLFEGYTNIAVDGKPFNEFFADFSPVLSDFEQALKSNDTVSIGDLAEYEICPRLLAIAKTLESIR